MDISDRIKQERISIGLSQTELAKRAGIKQPSLSAIENGTAKNIRATTLSGVAKGLGVNQLWLETGKGEKRATATSRTAVREDGVTHDLNSLISIATYLDELTKLQQAEDKGLLEESDKALIKIIAEKYRDRI